MMQEGQESSSDEDEEPIQFGEYKEGEEEFKGHVVEEENDSVNEDEIF